MDDRFTGGNAFQPGSFEWLLHASLMKNELMDGRGAYRMSNAKAGASGPSFGAFQYDLGSNAHGRRLIEHIARTVVNDAGKRFVVDRELILLQEVGYQPFGRMSEGERASYLQLKPQLDAMLSSPQARQIINADYVEKIHEKVQAVNATVLGVKGRENREFLEATPLARLIIADTRNQFGTGVNRGLKRWIDMAADDAPLRMYSRDESIRVNGRFGLEDLVRFKLETEYAQVPDQMQDTLRRISNMVRIIGPENVPLSHEDHEFFRSGLRKYIRGNGFDPGFLDREREFAPLRALGNAPRIGQANRGHDVIANRAGLDNPAHPAFALFTDASNGITALNARFGIPDDPHSINAAAALAQAAHGAGLTRIDHVLLGHDASRMFAVEGEPDSLAKRYVSVDVTQARMQPVEESARRIEAAMVDHAHVEPPVQALGERVDAPAMRMRTA